MSVPTLSGVLRHVMEARRLDPAGLAALAGVAEQETAAILGGAPPPLPSMGPLARALGLTTADLYEIAGVSPPWGLLPRDRGAQGWLPDLVALELGLPARFRRELCRLARSLPVGAEAAPPPDRPYERYPPGPGALLVRMLGNRNLGWSAAAQVLARMTDTCLSAATIGALGRGRIEPTPELTAGLGTVLGLPADVLTALTGAAPSAVEPAPQVADAALLIRDTSRLTEAQVLQLIQQARSMITERRE
ncbi:hypothetical protein [Streptomyces sp. NPDC001770]